MRKTYSREIHRLNSLKNKNKVYTIKVEINRTITTIIINTEHTIKLKF